MCIKIRMQQTIPKQFRKKNGALAQLTEQKNTKRLKVNISCENEKSNYIYDYIIENYIQIREISKKFNKDETLTKINVILDFSDKSPIKSMYKSFENLEGIESISIQEFVE